MMQRFEMQIRLNQTQTTRIVINAMYASEAKALAEAQYGKGSVMWIGVLSD